MVTVCGPATLMPPGVETMGVTVSHDIDDLLPTLDVLMILRIQTERLSQCFFPSLREYAELFGIDSGRMAKAKKDVIVMHPGPLNRGVEITPEVADGANSVILDQVKYGVAVRMAVLYLLSGGETTRETAD
jgi:aspartate carbamoyltransferase catalytic subunit